MALHGCTCCSICSRCTICGCDHFRQKEDETMVALGFTIQEVQNYIKKLGEADSELQNMKLTWVIICNPNDSGRRTFVGPYDIQKEAYDDRNKLLEKFKNLTLEQTGIVCVFNFEDSIESIECEI